MEKFEIAIEGKEALIIGPRNINSSRYAMEKSPAIWARMPLNCTQPDASELICDLLNAEQDRRMQPSDWIEPDE